MVNIPPEIYKSISEIKLKRGDVIKTVIKFRNDDIERPKFFILVSQNVKAECLLFVITTSKIEFFNNNPQFSHDILRIAANQLFFFPKETIIDCRHPHPITKKELLKNFQERKLEFSGNLSPLYLKRIDEIIRNSRYISPKTKKLILGNPFSKS